MAPQLLQGNCVFEEDLSQVTKIIEDLFPLDESVSTTSYRLPDTKEPGFSSIFVNNLCHAKNDDKVYEYITPLMDTIDKVIGYYTKVHADLDCFGERKFNKETGQHDPFFTFESYARIAERRLNLGSGFIKFLESNKFVTPKHDSNDFILTMYSKNRLEWALTDLACSAYGIVSTLLYDTLGSESSQYILELTNSPIVVCSKSKIEAVLKLKPQLPFLIGIISMDSLDSGDKLFAECDSLGIELIDFATVEKLGLDNPQVRHPPTSDSIYTISFTSGTTSRPKGVVISHRALTVALAYHSIHVTRPTRGNVFSFLPLAHIFERASFTLYLMFGMSICLPNESDSALTLIENLKISKPVALVLVPRLFNRLESALKVKVETSKLLQLVVNRKMAKLKARNGKAPLFLADQLIISKFRAAVGFDNMEWCISGSAPISESTVQFLRLALNIGFAQGYGATEVCGGGAISSVYDKDVHCGSIGATLQLKLRDLPDLNYRCEDENGNDVLEPSGELWLRGGQMFTEYYKDPESTKDTLDEEGWYHTGDVVKIDSHGHLKVVDRIKNFFKLAQGEFVVPEKIENIYTSHHPFITQVFVHGNLDQRHVIGIIGLEKAFVESAINSVYPDKKSFANDLELVKLLNSLEVKKHILSILNHQLVTKQLSGYERLHNIHIDFEPLKIEDDVITPTFKIKRNKAKNLFSDIITNLYLEGSLIGSKLKL